MAGDDDSTYNDDVKMSGSSDKEEEFVDEDSKMEAEEDGETQQLSTSTTQTTKKSKSTPSKSSKKDKYSEANVKARTNADGSVIPVTKPKLLPSGKYQRPKGRGRNGCSWDEDRGEFLYFVMCLFVYCCCLSN